MYRKKEKKVRFEQYEKLSGDQDLDFDLDDAKRNKELQYVPKEKVSFGFRLKRFWFGLIKERRRISWARPRELGIGMITVLSIMVVLAAVFFLITWLMIRSGIVF